MRRPCVPGQLDFESPDSDAPEAERSVEENFGLMATWWWSSNGFVRSNTWWLAGRLQLSIDAMDELGGGAIFVPGDTRLMRTGFQLPVLSCLATGVDSAAVAGLGDIGTHEAIEPSMEFGNA